MAKNKWVTGSWGYNLTPRGPHVTPLITGFSGAHLGSWTWLPNQKPSSEPFPAPGKFPFFFAAGIGWASLGRERYFFSERGGI